MVKFIKSWPIGQLLITLLFSSVFLCSFSRATEFNIEVETEFSEFSVGDKIRLLVKVLDAPEVYGTDIVLKYDPKYLKTNPHAKKNLPGAFFDPKKSFFLRNRTNDLIGNIEYTVALVNPAPSKAGFGEIFSTEFTAVAEGNTTIEVAKAEFGTKTGNTVYPGVLGSTSITIEESNKWIWFSCLIISLLVSVYCGFRIVRELLLTRSAKFSALV